MPPLIVVAWMVLSSMQVSATVDNPRESQWRPLSTMDLQPGVHYRSGTRIRAADYGISFTIPQDWFGAMPPGSRTLSLESATRAGLGLVSLLRGVTPEEMEEHLNEPQVIEEGYTLHPVGSAKRSDQRITATYHSGEDDAVALVLFGPDGTGIVFMVTGPKPEKSFYEQVLDQLATSVQFFPPQPEAPERSGDT